MKQFLKTYTGVVLNPGKAFRTMLDGNYTRDGFLYMLIPLGLYTLMYVFLTIGRGAPSTFTPWLNISREDYYFYNQFLLAPSLVLAWFASAAFMQVVGRAFGGSGTFEQTLALMGLSISVAMWTTLVHDLTMSFLSAVQVIDAHQHEIAMNSPTIWRTILWICFAGYFFAFSALFYKCVRVVHNLGKVAGLLTGLLSFLIFQLIFLIFNR